MQASSPFFSNDQWGILRVLLFVVGPIVLSIGSFVWFLVNRQERQDINAVGRRVNEVEERATKSEGRINVLEDKIADDRLAYSSQLWAAQKSIDEQFTRVQTALARVEERVCAPADLKDAMVAAVREAVRELKKGD